MFIPKFDVEFLEEASAFLDKLDEKVRDKIFYNITKARFTMTRSFLKN
jgi:mRNA-degrading endonuclease RelE of RelBE toxin-antitoxin system